MSRKYETTVPYRPEMIDIIRAALDHGVTFIDTAEAYGLSNANEFSMKASRRSAIEWEFHRNLVVTLILQRARRFGGMGSNAH